MRTVSVKDIQDAVADVRLWANDGGDSSLGPPKQPDLLKALAEVIEQLLVNRESA